MVISNGGVVNSGAINYGGVIGAQSSSSSNSVLVTGIGSTWDNSALVIGLNGSYNSLTISNGGTVTNSFTPWGVEIGRGADSSNNSIVVTGSGSSLTSPSDITIGQHSSGNSVTIANGGTLSSGQIFTGGVIGMFSDSSNNSVLVTGAGSTWSNNGTLTIGDAGSGSLTVANGGTVSATGGITIASAAGSVGTLNIGSLGGSDTAGTIVTPTIAFGAGTGAINFNQGDSATVSAAISGNGSVNQLGSGTTTLTGVNTFSGGSSVTQGMLRVGSASALGSGGATLSGGSLSFASTLSVSSLVWNAAAALSIDTLTAQTALTITGDLTLSGTGLHTLKFGAGTLGTTPEELISWGTANSYTSGSFLVTGLGNNLLQISNNALYISALGTNPIVLGNGDSVGVSGTFSNNVTVAAGNTASIANIDSNTPLIITGNLSKDGGVLIIQNGANINGRIIGSSANSDLVIDGGTTTLNQSNSYNGPTMIINGATLNAAVAGALPTENGRTAIFLDQDNKGTAWGSGSSTLALQASQSVASLSGEVSSTVALGGTTLTVGTDGTTNAFAGTIADGTSSGGSLVKDGNSTQILTGNNSYSGTTTISGGTLQIGNGGTSGTLGSGAVVDNGSLVVKRSDAVTLGNAISGTGSFTQAGAGTTTLTRANTYSGTTTVNSGTLLANNTSGSAVGTSVVTVQSGGTLGGNGTIGGATTIASGGLLTPGSSGTGALSFSNGLTLESGSITTFLINSTGDFTSINILGNTINYGGELVFNITSYTPAAGDAFTLFNMTGGATQSGGFSSVTAGSLIFTESSGIWSASYGAYDYQFSQSTGQLSVAANLQGVPEPSTYALLGLGALALLIAYRRKSRKVA